MIIKNKTDQPIFLGFVEPLGKWLVTTLELDNSYSNNSSMIIHNMLY